MSEELNKEMDELEEADKTAKKIVKHPIGDDEQGDPDMDKGIKKAADNKTKGKPTSETKEVKEGELPPALAKAIAKKKKDNGDDEEDEEEEEEQTKKEAVQVPKLKSEILAGLVDHLRGLKKEDLSKMYGSTVLGEQEDDDEEDDDEDDDENEDEDEDEDEDEKHLCISVCSWLLL